MAATTLMLAKAASVGLFSYGVFDWLDHRLQLSHDIEFLVRVAPHVAQLKSLKNMHPVDVFLQSVEKYSSQDGLISADTGHSVTYAEVDAITNRIAHWGLSSGFKRGDIVALFMTNRIEYICMWLGLAKIGKNFFLHLHLYLRLFLVSCSLVVN
mgnify:FL=1